MAAGDDAFLGSLPGLRGPTGIPGPNAVDAPSDGTVYGRAPGSWLPVLPLTGGGLSGGLSFGSDVASGPTDLSRHMALWGTQYGFNVTSGTLNYNAQFNNVFYCGGANTFRPIRSGAVINHGLGSSTVPCLSYTTTNGNITLFNTLLWYNSGGVSGGGMLVTNNIGVNITNEVSVGSTGIARVSGGTTAGINWRWDGSRMLMRQGNQWEVVITIASDERLKQDIAPSTFDCMAALRRVRLWQYRWQAMRDAGVRPIGLVAQRLAEDFPEAVQRPNGAPVKGATQIWGIERNVMMALLCGSAQQLANRLDALHVARRA